jgi:hypothetical protein
MARGVGFLPLASAGSRSRTSCNGIRPDGRPRGGSTPRWHSRPAANDPSLPVEESEQSSVRTMQAPVRTGVSTPLSGVDAICSTGLPPNSTGAPTQARVLHTALLRPNSPSTVRVQSACSMPRLSSAGAAGQGRRRSDKRFPQLRDEATCVCHPGASVSSATVMTLWTSRWAVVQLPPMAGLGRLVNWNRQSGRDDASRHCHRSRNSGAGAETGNPGYHYSGCESI